MWILAISGIVTAVVLWLLISRSIVDPLDRTVRLLDAVAGGDLTVFLAETSHDEIGQMGRALNRTVARLRDNLDELTAMARTDSLTGLANRSAFNTALALAMDPSSARPSSVLFIDLDDFKHVNDSFGHHHGDVVLVAIAERLRHNVREHDLCARLGGDEFAVLMHDADLTVATQIAARIVDALVAPIATEAATTTVGASIGVASAGGRTPVKELIHQADTAMYTAKKLGKNTVVAYSPRLAHLYP